MKSITPGRGPSMMGGFGALASVAFGVIWTLQTQALVVCPHQLPQWWLPASLLYPVYYLAVSLYLNKRPDGQ